MRYRTSFVFSVVLAASVLTSEAQAANTIPWRTRTFVYDAQQKKLSEFLQEFAASQGISAVVDKDIDDTVSAHFSSSPEDVLKLVAGSYGLVWYYDGSTLYFSKAQNNKTKMIRLNAGSIQRLKAGLRDLKIEDSRFPLSQDDKSNIVIVSGPPRYVDLVDQYAKSLDQGGPVANEEIRVFPLRYAWAQDKTVGTSTTPSPGVATTLKKLFGQSSQPQGSRSGGSSARKVLSQTRNSIVTSSVLGQMEVPESMSDAMQRWDDEKRSADSGGGKDQLPSIEADGRTNSVIVRDTADRMDLYAKTIQALDVRPGQIEIVAHIIDVEIDSAESLGVEWQYTSSNVNANFSGRPATTNADGTIATGISSSVIAGNVPGAVAATLIGNSVRNLLLTINALEQAGKARIVSEPKVLTLDNVEASLSNTQTYYVRVAGNLSAELFNVTAGTTLKVTPLMVIDDSGARRVKLALHAEDGSLSKNLIDNLPVVERRNIDTQALIGEGESLLVGGLVYQQDTSSVNGIPGLSRIPILGALFRQNNSSSTRIERLFLITPRILTEP